MRFAPSGTVCRAGPSSMQLYGLASLDARQMIYACFVELVLRSVKKKIRTEAQEGTPLAQRARCWIMFLMIL